MPQVTLKHPKITDEEATKPPKRDPVPEGTYAATIMKAPLDTTNHKPTPLAKIAVEFQLLYRINDDGSKDEEVKARRVFQDFILEPLETMPDISARWVYELRMLLDATGIEFTDEGFNSDHLVGKSVKIFVKHKRGEADADGEVPIYTNVKKIDCLEEASSEDLI